MPLPTIHVQKGWIWEMVPHTRGLIGIKSANFCGIIRMELDGLQASCTPFRKRSFFGEITTTHSFISTLIRTSFVHPLKISERVLFYLWTARPALCVYIFKSQMINQVSSSPSDNRSCWRQIYGYSIFVLVSANLGKQSPSCRWDESNKSWFFHFLFLLLLKPCLRPCHLLYSWQPEHPVGWNSFKDLTVIFHPLFSL